MQDFKVQGNYVLWTCAILFVLQFIQIVEGSFKKNHQTLMKIIFKT